MVLAAHATNPKLYRTLTAVSPLVLGTDAVHTFERAHHAAVANLLRRHATELRPRNLDIAAFVVAQCLESLTHGAVTHYPELLDQPTLAEEIAELLLRYLQD